jgi:paraquat-inducible protein B
MSKKANPAIVGGFVVAALITAVIGVIYLGSIKLASDNAVYTLFFNESLNGLEVGASVKFRGIKIGRVTDIKISLPNQPKEYEQYLPVTIEVDVDALCRLQGRELGTPEERHKRLSKLIDNGLRAHLSLESLITGLYYIEIDFRKGPPPPLYILPRDGTCRELPTAPSMFASLGESAHETLVRLGALDIEGIAKEIIDIARKLNRNLDDLKLGRLQKAFESTLTAARNRLNDKRIDKAIDKFTASIENTDKLLERVQKDVFSEDSTIRYELEQGLKDLRAAANAIRSLAESIERNPSSLIRGKVESP